MNAKTLTDLKEPFPPMNIFAVPELQKQWRNNSLQNSGLVIMLPSQLIVNKRHVSI